MTGGLLKGNLPPERHQPHHAQQCDEEGDVQGAVAGGGPHGGGGWARMDQPPSDPTSMFSRVATREKTRVGFCMFTRVGTREKARVGEAMFIGGYP